MTNVFISWSGQQSKEIAEELRSWIPSVLQFAKPYFTPNDIEKGAKWSTEISAKLAETNVGIICLTKENHSKPWILFEAGALSKDLEKSKVCSIIFGMENTDLTGPLTTFQTTVFDKTDFRKLMLSINEAGGDRALPRDTFDNVFNMWWPRLEEKVSKIIAKGSDEETGELRSERDLLEEILSLTRLTARRYRSIAPVRGSVPPGFVDHFLTVIDSTIDLYEQDEQKSLYSVLSQQFELCDYLIKSDNQFEDMFRARWTDQSRRFENVIPF